MSAFKSHLGQRTTADLASADLSSLVNSTLPANASYFWGGAWHAGGPQLVSHNPSIELPLGEFALGSRAEIDAAVQSAHRGFPSWSSTPPLGRARRLRLASSIVCDHALELALLGSSTCCWQHRRSETARTSTLIDTALDGIAGAGFPAWRAEHGHRGA